MKDVYNVLLLPLLLRYFVGAFILSAIVATEVPTFGIGRRRKDIGNTSLQKVLLTQKGYIQFLKWEVPVPNIDEFTFCLWFESTNLTHSHPIFSYSKNEDERLARSWISSGGKSVHLEIAGWEVLKQSVRMEENRWYHICQSWENRLGRYALWIDARIVTQGQHDASKGHVIPRGGDIVLGQEYTDFDKGLEDGIEGAVLGFNFLLASAFAPFDSGKVGSDRTDGNAHYENVKYDSDRSDIWPYTAYSYAAPSYIILPSEMRGQYFRVRWYCHSVHRSPYLDHLKKASRQRTIAVRRESCVPLTDGEMNVEATIKNDPFGLQLVKLSYVRCELGRASPRVGGSLMLISWSRTPVRVFGGAVLINARNECGHF